MTTYVCATSIMHADACGHMHKVCVTAAQVTHLRRPMAVHTASKDPLESQARDREPSLGFCTEYMQPSARSPLAEQ